MAEWIRAAEPVAYGPLGLKPWEFGRLTVGEFAQLAEGYLWRIRQEQIFSAGVAASIINCCSPNKLKRPVTVEMLLGKEPEKAQGKNTREEMNKLLSTVG